MAAPLPTDLAEAHALILRQRDALAAATARASGAEAMIAHLKLLIAKYKRERWGQSAERGRKLLDQLELQLEELEATALKMRLPPRRRRRHRARCRPSNGASRCALRCRRICRASAS
jgi:hypothetical protein